MQPRLSLVIGAVIAMARTYALNVVGPITTLEIVNKQVSPDGFTREYVYILFLPLRMFLVLPRAVISAIHYDVSQAGQLHGKFARFGDLAVLIVSWLCHCSVALLW
jgi:hypothetical protein